MAKKQATGEVAAATAKPNKKQRREAEKANKAAAAATTHAAVDKEIKGEAKEKPVTISNGMPPLPKMPKAGSGSRERQPKPLKDCTCGCKGQTTGNWVPGHDARARGWAIRIERGLLTMKDVPENERPGAKFMLKEREAKGLTGKGITLAKGKSTETAPEKSEIDIQVEAAIADGMSEEAAEGFRASLEAAAATVVNG